MANNLEKLTKLEALWVLALKLHSDYALKTDVTELAGRLGTLEELEIPSKVSQLTNDSDFQSGSQVEGTIKKAISESGHAGFRRADAIPTAEEAQDNILYLVMNDRTGHYDIYAKVDGTVVRLDDTTVDLSGYVTTETLSSSLTDLTNDFDTKLNGMIASNDEVTTMLDSVFNPADEGA